MESQGHRGVLVPPALMLDDAPAAAAEPNWRHAGADDPRVAIEAAVASVKRAKRRSHRGRGGTAAATSPAQGDEG